MAKKDIIHEILNRKVEKSNPNISDILDRYELSPAEQEAADKYGRRIDAYMDICHGVVPDPERGHYVCSDRVFRKAMKIATTIPLLIAGGIGVLYRKHLLKTAALAVAITAASRAVERRYGLITHNLEKGGPLSWAAAMDVHLAGRNLERVIKAEEQKKQ